MNNKQIFDETGVMLHPTNKPDRMKVSFSDRKMLGYIVEELDVWRFQPSAGFVYGSGNLHSIGTTLELLNKNEQS